jgi:hypothetical protein
MTMLTSPAVIHPTYRYYIALDNKINDEIERNWKKKKRGSGLIEVTSRNLPGGTE